MSNIGDMNNMIAKETSYMNSNTSETDNMVDDAIDNNTELVLPKPKFAGSNQLPLAKLHVSESCSFEPVRSFTLDVDLAVVPKKTNGNKLISIKKIFYRIDGFGGASTSSKFPEIIKASFTSESSMNKARKLVVCENIIVNNDLKKVNKYSDKEIVVKKILVNLLKLAVKSVFSKFGKIVSIKMQLIVGTTAHDLSDLLESYGKKTCFIGHNPTSYVYDRCAIVCFVDKASKLAAIGFTPVFKGVNLHWAGLSLACCAHCKQFGHISTGCSLDGNSGARGKQVVTPQDQVSGIMKKLSFVELVPLASKPPVLSSVVLASVTSNLDSDMTLDVTTVFSSLSLLIVTDPAADLGLSSSKVLTSKVGGLEFKIVALEVLVKSVLEKLNCLCSGLDMDNLVSIFMEMKLKNKARLWLVNKFDDVCVFSSGLDFGYVGAGVAIVMNRSLAKYVYKADEINSLITRAVNESSFVIFGGNFNEDGSHKCTSFKRCHDLGLVNSLGESSFTKVPTWSNSQGVLKMINYVFVSSNLVNVIMQHDVFIVSEHFDMDHRTVFVSLDLGGLLDTRLNSLCKQMNKD
ncbi:hypothetical protein G9A89_022828 [Geosiphon pyriformis]|nr:hypothetical protein G9A89_022828 [Geosiphon pyriformis]